MPSPLKRDAAVEFALSNEMGVEEIWITHKYDHGRGSEQFPTPSSLAGMVMKEFFMVEKRSQRAKWPKMKSHWKEGSALDASPGHSGN